MGASNSRLPAALASVVRHLQPRTYPYLVHTKENLDVIWESLDRDGIGFIDRSLLNPLMRKAFIWDPSRGANPMSVWNSCIRDAEDVLFHLLLDEGESIISREDFEHAYAILKKELATYEPVKDASDKEDEKSRKNVDVELSDLSNKEQVHDNQDGDKEEEDRSHAIEASNSRNQDPESSEPHDDDDSFIEFDMSKYEKMIIFMDVSDHMSNTEYSTDESRELYRRLDSRLDVARRSLTSVISAKWKISTKHEYLVSGLREKPAVNGILTSSALSTSRSLSELRCYDLYSKTDLTAVFRECARYLASPGQTHIAHAVLVYGRDDVVPEIDYDDADVKRVLSHPSFFIDILFLHSPAQPDSPDWSQREAKLREVFSSLRSCIDRMKNSDRCFLFACDSALMVYKYAMYVGAMPSQRVPFGQYENRLVDPPVQST